MPITPQQKAQASLLFSQPEQHEAPPIKPSILIVFGLSGAGKSTVAKLIGDQLGFYHQEGDDLLTETLIRKFVNYI